jgi:anti-sigma factor RsiW
MHTCDRIRDRLVELVEGELPARLAREAQEHIARCPECTREVRELQTTLARLQTLPEPALPDGLFDDIAATVRRRIAHEAPPRLPRHQRLATWLRGVPSLRPVPALSAAAALGLLLAVGLARAPRTPQPSPTIEFIAAGESLPIAQNLDILEQFDLLEDLDLLEQLPALRAPGNGRSPKMG